MTPTPCRPRRSWDQRRRLAVLIGSAVSLAVLLAAFLGPWRREVFAPGPLSQSHAQILGSSAQNDRCAACHSVARRGLAAWFGSGRAGHAGVSQTQLCIECHHATIQPERARAAHNLTSEELRLVAEAADSNPQRFPGSLTQIARREITWHDSMPRPPFTNDDVQCAACHREHSGKSADLTWLSSAQCQTCHQDRFASFAHGHPEWQRWPYGRGGQIAFNHATHQGDHFAKEGKSFDCQACHTVTTAGEISRTGSFETSCAACHDQSLRLQAGQGIDLVALPMLDIDAVREAGISVARWPEGASGVDEISFSPLTRILLAGDPVVVDAIDQLTDPTANLWQGPPSPTRLRATATVAAALHTLVSALADDPQGTLQGALEGRLPGVGAPGILGQLSPQLIATARDRWFAPTEAGAGDDAAQASAAVQGSDSPVGDAGPLQSTDQLLLSPPQDELLLSDPLLSDPLEQSAAESVERGERFDPARLLPRGGWYRDDLQFAIRYRGAGHADPVLRSVVELAADASLAAAGREALLELPAVAACIECHPAVRRGEDASWRSIRSDAGRRSFTRFSHRPHLHLPVLSDCTHCHTVSGAMDFEPLARASCVQCHTPQAAGDNCTQCHLYHVDP